MRRITALTIAATLTLAACGDSGRRLNPLRWKLQAELRKPCLF